MNFKPPSRPPTTRLLAAPLSIPLLACRLVLFLATLAANVSAATISAASPAQADVAAALLLANDGDIVTIPEGTATWTTPLTVAKAVTLRGTPQQLPAISSISATNPAVVTTVAPHGLSSGNAVWISEVVGGTVAAGAPSINGAYVATVTGPTTFTIPKAVTVAPNPSTGSLMRLATIIEDGGSGGRLMTWSLVQDKTSRMTLIEFRRGTRSAFFDGLIYVAGRNTDSRRIRIDQCAFLNLNGFMLRIEGALGVAHSNVFRYTASNYPFYIYHRNWNGGTYAEGSWSAPTNFGSEDFWFIEDNTIEYYSSGADHRPLVDGYGGARFVIRYNTAVRCMVEAHGTESAGRWRGTRAVEVYNNEFRGSDGGTIVVNLRSGAGVFHSNRVSRFQNPPQTPTGPVFTLRNHRQFYPFSPWGPSDGRSAWDRNTAGGPFASHTASSGGTFNVTTAGAGWTPNQWAGYSIVKTSNVGRGQTSSYITSNTADTISYASDNGYAAGNTALQLHFSAGDTFEIWRVDESLDQPGRTGGSLIRGDNPTPPSGGNDQVDDPIYAWDNTRESGVNITIGAGQPSIRLNEHFFNNVRMPGYTPYGYPHLLRRPAPPSHLRVSAN